MHTRALCWGLLILMMNLRTPSLLADKWMFSVLDAGVGLGVDSERSDLAKESYKGGLYSLDFGSFSFDLRSAGGFAFGAKIYETMGRAFMNDHMTRASFLPVYVHYTVYSRIEKVDHGRSGEVREMRSPHIYVFAGGTALGRGRDYIHAGVDALFGVYSLSPLRPGSGCLSNAHPFLAATCLIGISLAQLALEQSEAIPAGCFGIRGGALYSPGDQQNGQHGEYCFYISLRAIFFGFH